jgi:L-seryl-tRNA(Ser) seleniumtransferase
MATGSIESLRARAEKIVRQLPSSHFSMIRVIDTESLPGAGSAPGSVIPSVALTFAGDHSEQLRRHSTPVIARVDGNATIIDLRSCSVDDDHVLVNAISEISI